MAKIKFWELMFNILGVLLIVSSLISGGFALSSDFKETLSFFFWILTAGVLTGLSIWWINKKVNPPKKKVQNH